MDVTFERLDIFPSATHTALNVSKEAKSLFTKFICSCIIHFIKCWLCPNQVTK